MNILQSPDMIVSYSPLFVFVSLVKRYSLENFGSNWRATVVDFQTFEKKQTKLLKMQGGC
jgi:hypothetical protein